MKELNWPTWIFTFTKSVRLAFAAISPALPKDFPQARSRLCSPITKVALRLILTALPQLLTQLLGSLRFVAFRQALISLWLHNFFPDGHSQDGCPWKSAQHRGKNWRSRLPPRLTLSAASNWRALHVENCLILLFDWCPLKGWRSALSLRAKLRVTGVFAWPESRRDDGCSLWTRCPKGYG